MARRSASEGDVASFAQVLQIRGVEEPDAVGYTFLGASGEAACTYGELDQRARQVAGILSEHCRPGDRALLLLPPGLDYVASFFGCLYAGVVAVPAYPPQRSSRRRSLSRLESVIADARPTVALTGSDLLDKTAQLAQEHPSFGALRWIAVDALADGAVPRPEPAAPRPSDLAFLQYTSGSTAAPKGVMVTHANLLHNAQQSERFFELSPRSSSVFWLPPYHDMGLIGGILQPMYSGYPVALMSPARFIQRPMRWVEAVSRFRATISGGPSFAYDLCARKAKPEQVADLDLRCWQAAFNGAEPVRAEVLDRFTDAFADAGFQRRAFFPCYGLAEATLIVTGGAVDEPPVVRHDRVPAGDGNGRLAAAARARVGCGRAHPDQRLIIVDPQTRAPCPAGTEGEIWVSGPSVARGYWGREEETAETFRATVRGGDETPFLRTGDLGFLVDGELFVTGRIKDLIILGGENHYPQDIEEAAEGAHPALQPNGGAAFSTIVDGVERLVVVHEVSRRHVDCDVGEVCAAIGSAVSEAQGVTAHAIVLVRPSTLPKTSSGKAQRYLARDRYAQGALGTLGERTSEPGADLGAELDDALLRAAAPTERPGLVTAFIQRWVAARVGADPGGVDADRSGPSQGLDSLALIELQHALESRTGAELPLEGLFHEETLASIAGRVVETLQSPERPAAPAEHVEGPLQPSSHGQRALWFLEQLSGAEGAYNLAGAVRLVGGADLDALATAFERLAERHTALRTTFEWRDGELAQRIAPSGDVEFRRHANGGHEQGGLEERLVEVAHRPFDLGAGPLLRVEIWERSGEDPVLLLVLHHAVGDFWSLAVMLEELGDHYRAALSGTEPSLPPEAGYHEFARQQAAELEGSAGERSEAFWLRELAGEVPVLELPTDRPRPRVQSYAGDSLRFSVDADVADGLRRLARSSQTTLFAVLLAAYQTLLHRYTGQTDILVGSPTAGRGRAARSRTVGYFVNPVVLRGDLGGDPPFRELLRQLSGKVSAALAHQDYPFPLLAERLQPERDPARSPLFQTMLMFQRSPLAEQPRLGVAALGEPGVRLAAGDLELETVGLPQRASQFDLTLSVAEDGEELRGAFQFATALFDRETIEGMARAFVTILRGIAEAPDTPIGELPVLDDRERERLLVDWNDTAVPFPCGTTIADEFRERVAEDPAAVAVAHGGRSMTYSELDARAGDLARCLASHGVGPECRVGIRVERSPELLVALLGVLRSGAAYVPIDPSHPSERTNAIISDADISVLVTDGCQTGTQPPDVALLDLRHPLVEGPSGAHEPTPPEPGNAAYVIYTSGSSGTPKGVTVTHRNVVSFFAGMDARVGCGPDDVLLAVTSVSFDISVLELLWTLCRGARVAMVDDRALGRGLRSPADARRKQAIDFSLFYFASAATASAGDKYRLVLEGARFADQHGLTAVWTPERHFHDFGGLYPNPSVLTAALAATTERVRLRAGSVVLPLHEPLRVAEEWAVVDNLSGGRVGVAFASGWHADDFALRPDDYADRKASMFQGIETVHRLWQQGKVRVPNGVGNEIEVGVHPAPVQPSLPTWITAAGHPDTFVRAGEIGANVLTHLLGQSVEQVASKVQAYREARARCGHDPDSGIVTLMLHTFLGDDVEAVRSAVREPFKAYLRSSVGLMENLAKSLDTPLDLATMSERDMDGLLEFAFERYFQSSALFGTCESVSPLIDRLAACGIDEIACLIDFGLAEEDVLSGLSHVAELHRRHRDDGDAGAGSESLAEIARAQQPTLLQATPSMMRLLALDAPTLESLRSVRSLLLGGEPLPASLASTLREALPARLLNMYGPTETTIWSSVHRVDEVDGAVPIGRPIPNTRMHVVGPDLEPVPVGVTGELLIGGEGVTRGYWGQPGLTAERFVPDPFGPEAGGRLYRTGDLARYRADGTIEFLGRADRQVKVRGLRIEPGEVESALGRVEGVQAAAVVAADLGPDDVRLIAYVVPAAGASPTAEGLQAAMRARVPEYMVPARFVMLRDLPLTPNGKVDLKALPDATDAGTRERAGAPPRNELEQRLASIWREALQVESVGIHDNFFDLGGHSLLMVRVHAEVTESLRDDVPLVTLLEYPTVSALASFLAGERDDAPSFEASQERARKQRGSRRRYRTAAGGGAHG